MDYYRLASIITHCYRYWLLSIENTIKTLNKIVKIVRKCSCKPPGILSNFHHATIFSTHLISTPHLHNLRENQLTESTVLCGRLDGWTDEDMTKPIFASRKFVNASKNHLELISLRDCTGHT